jgi:hypothetical protein
MQAADQGARFLGGLECADLAAVAVESVDQLVALDHLAEAVLADRSLSSSWRIIAARFQLPPKNRLQVQCVQQVEGGPSQPVEPGDDNGIASAYGLEHPHKLRPVAPGAPI